ncbi:hypothetical protein NEICINOT_04782 [Neisseria cinerea ATCC 14685]|uniref:Uncharacterized protein n=1 Tax=Neisseria cinerea ATCC 14685 TaxID=546262 RepID=D0W532_NEICI|nr:hypothetical protein NEICINOT_04782 [Neisseria cinerea ATCC 14685]
MKNKEFYIDIPLKSCMCCGKQQLEKLLNLIKRGNLGVIC